MTKLTRLIAPICILVLGLALAACGSDDDKALSKEEFVKQANALCTTANQATEAVGKDLSEDATAEQIATLYLEEAIPIYDKLFDDLEALDPPKADKEQVETLIAEARTATDTLEADFKTNPTKAMTEGESVYKKANADAAAYGLTVCAS